MTKGDKDVCNERLLTELKDQKLPGHDGTNSSTAFWKDSKLKVSLGCIVGLGYRARLPYLTNRQTEKKQKRRDNFLKNIAVR